MTASLFSSRFHVKTRSQYLITALTKILIIAASITVMFKEARGDTSDPDYFNPDLEPCDILTSHCFNTTTGTVIKMVAATYLSSYGVPSVCINISKTLLDSINKSECNITNRCPCPEIPFSSRLPFFDIGPNVLRPCSLITFSFSNQFNSSCVSDFIEKNFQACQTAIHKWDNDSRLLTDITVTTIVVLLFTIPIAITCCYKLYDYIEPRLRQCLLRTAIKIEEANARLEANNAIFSSEQNISGSHHAGPRQASRLPTSSVELETINEEDEYGLLQPTL